MGRNSGLALLILACLWLCPRRSSGFSWNIFSSSSSSSATAGERSAPMMELDGGAVADFSMDGTNDPRGLKLLENAWGKLAGPKNCWQEAYRKLFASCGEIMADKEKQSRLAWHLSSCFQEDSGRPPFPRCGESSEMVYCRKRLGDSEDQVFLEFFLETNTLCHQLQAEAFKHNTERLVNDLTKTSKSAEEKLEVIEERSDQIIKESGKVQETLSSIEMQADHLAETAKNVEVQISDVLAHSKAIFEQSKEIADSQAKLREGQTEMRETIDAGMVRIQESYESLGDGMDRLKEEAVDIQREIKTVGDSMSSKMQDLQSTANDIGSVAGKSLENQMHLLDGQSKAMDGLNNLYSFQAQALEESRETMQKLAQFGQRQQEELLSRQEEIRQAHDHLIHNSHSILEAQEEFRAKQANIFAALNKLYILHNAILAESRFIKAFFFYCCIVFLIYVLTSAKQTFSIRGHLYFGSNMISKLYLNIAMQLYICSCLPSPARFVHHSSARNWPDQAWSRRHRQAILGAVQGVPRQISVPCSCHCSDVAFHIHIQGLRSAKPSPAPNAGREGPGTGGNRRRRREDAVLRQHGEREEPGGLLVGVRRSGRRRGGQQSRPELRLAGGWPSAGGGGDGGGSGSSPEARRLAGGGRRRELRHDVGWPEVQPAAAEQ